MKRKQTKSNEIERIEIQDSNVQKYIIYLKREEVMNNIL